MNDVALEPDQARYELALHLARCELDLSDENAESVYLAMLRLGWSMRDLLLYGRDARRAAQAALARQQETT